jgi:hypothetical protein
VLFRLSILIIILIFSSFTNTRAQIMRIHLGEEEHDFNLSAIDSISFADSEPHFQYDVARPTMSILISEALLNDESLITNDEIGVFNPRRICSGASVVPETFPEEPMGLGAFMGDQGEDRGFQPGEELDFRFWDASARREYVAEADLIEGRELIWVGNGFIRIALHAGEE